MDLLGNSGTNPMAQFVSSPMSFVSEASPLAHER